MRVHLWTVLLGLSIGPGWAQVNEPAIRGVAAGAVKVARASWWGFDAQDATRALQAAIDSGVPKLIVDNVGQPWIVESLTLRSGQEILFEPGVEVVAKRGAFKGTNDCLLSAWSQQNLTLRGYGATLRMQRSDYDGPDYRKAEWRHVLQLRGCSGVAVYGLTLAESGGDGIYLGSAQGGVTNKNILIKDVICDRNYRQGISVITAENLLIENCTLRDTAGTAPQAGIDFEPNNADERLVNCIMRHCTTRGNAGDGYELYLRALNADSEPVSMRFENCRSIGDAGAGARVVTGNAPAAAVGGRIEFVGCRFDGSQRLGVTVADVPAGGCRVRFERCTVENAAPSYPERSPILFVAGRDATEPVGGVELADCIVRDPVERRPLAFTDMAGVGLQDVRGRLIVERAGQRHEITLTEELLAEWMPAAALTPIPRVRLQGRELQPVEAGVRAPADALASARLRGHARLTLYARRDDEVRLRVGHGQVANYSGNPLPVVVIAPSGDEIHRGSAPFRQQAEIVFTAPATGLYSVAADPGANYLQVLHSSHPVLLNGEERPLHFYGPTGEFVFWVPAGVREFGVRVSGEGVAEAVRAALIDPAGEISEEVDNIAATHQFEVRLDTPSPGAAWGLRLARPSALVLEDVYVDLRGLPPLLAASRQALLQPR